MSAGDKLALAVIPEIDIWRAANLMLKRYGEKALEESTARADELSAAEDHNGADTWRRITVAVEQLANTTPPAREHREQRAIHPVFKRVQVDRLQSPHYRQHILG